MRIVSNSFGLRGWQSGDRATSARSFDGDDDHHHVVDDDDDDDDGDDDGGDGNGVVDPVWDGKGVKVEIGQVLLEVVRLEAHCHQCLELLYFIS